MKCFWRGLAISIALAWTLGFAICVRAQSNQAIYADGLSNNWVNYSWATVNFTTTTPTHSGSSAISVTCVSNNYQALYLHHNNAFDSTPYSNITFWVYVTSNGVPPLKLQGTLNGIAQSAYFQLPSLTASNWTQISVPLAAIGVASSMNMDGFWIQSENSSPIPAFYVDDITLVAGANTNGSGTNATTAITVDAGLNRHPISPLIYGVAFASQAQVADLNVPLNRSGGNAETRYNWQTNAHNHAADFYYESISDGSSTPGADADSFISATKAGGASPLISIPMIGWAPKLGPGLGKLASYSIAKYGPQTGNDSQYFPDAGNGISTTNSTPITWNDPNDANFPVNVAFQKAWVQHLTNTWGLSSKGGVGYYLMDNEHSIWFSTHQDIHPVGPTMREIYGDITNYAAMVKSVDSNALVLGPEEWGWNGYFYSGFDQQWSGQHNNYTVSQFPDRATNGGMDYMPWLLNQLHQYQLNTGLRLLDYFTLHCYPQENGVGGNAVDSATQILRNQTTRQFWDSNYVDPSWINTIIDLIPRMQSWVTAYYPGTKIGITEYNWGAESSINGATAQADILGIFGRQNLDLATRWTTPDATTPTYLAIKMYRNYDGNKSTFGDTSISTTGPNPDNVAVFGATRASDGALTVMVISKYLSGATPLALTITNFTNTGVAHVWQLNSSNIIAHLNDVALSGSSINAVVPGQSITLFVVPPKPVATLLVGPPRSDGQFQFSLNGQSGQTWILQFSTNLAIWAPVMTNIITNSQVNFLLPMGARQGFYRAHAFP